MTALLLPFENGCLFNQLVIFFGTKNRIYDAIIGPALFETPVVVFLFLVDLMFGRKANNFLYMMQLK